MLYISSLAPIISATYTTALQPGSLHFWLFPLVLPQFHGRLLSFVQIKSFMSEKFPGFQCQRKHPSFRGAGNFCRSSDGSL